MAPYWIAQRTRDSTGGASKTEVKKGTLRIAVNQRSVKVPFADLILLVTKGGYKTLCLLVHYNGRDDIKIRQGQKGNFRVPVVFWGSKKQMLLWHSGYLSINNIKFRRIEGLQWSWQYNGNRIIWIKCDIHNISAGQTFLLQEWTKRFM